LNVVDSSAWLEYFADGENARHFARPIEDPQNLIVPAICLLEVFKRVLQQRNETDALKVAAAMRQGQLVDLDAELALTAAQLGIAHRLPLANSVIYATARRFDATLWTQDGDFEGLAAVRYFAKRST